MRSTDQIHVMFLKEAGNNIGSEGEGNTTVILAPSGDVLVRIRPEQITEQTAVRNLRWSASVATSANGQKSLRKVTVDGVAYICRSHDTPYLLHRVEVWTQATMHGKDLLVNYGCDRQAVEAVRECLP